MADCEWRGDAVAVAELADLNLLVYVPGGRYGVKLYNEQIIEVTAPALGDNYPTAVEAMKYVSDTLITRFNNAQINAYYPTNPSAGALATVRLQSTPGESLGGRVRGTPACYVEEVRAGVASTAQVFRIVMPKGMTGGSWLMTFTWGTSSYPTSSIAYNATAATVQGEIVTAANEVASLSASGCVVNLIQEGSSTQNRIYEVTMGGGFVGFNFTVVPNGDALAGVGSVTATTVQLAAGSATAIQAVNVPLFPNLDNSRQQVFKISRDGVTSAEISVDQSQANLKAAIDSALATVLGAGKAVSTVAYYTASLGTSGGELVFVVKWNDLGTQASLSVTTYDKRSTSPYSIPTTCTTTAIRASGANQSEFLLAWVGVSSGGSLIPQPANYEVTQGVTTWTITHTTSSTTANLVTQWEAGVGSGNVGIYSLSKWSMIYVVEFKGSKANSDQAAVTFTTANGRTFQTICNGEPLLNEIQQVIINAKGGTFTASSDGTTFTSALAYNLNAASLQTALRGLAAIGSGNCNVTGSGTSSDPFLVEYVSGKAITDMPLLKFNIASLLGGQNPVITSITAAVLGVSQQSRIYLDPNLNGGYLIPIVNGVFDSRVAYNGNAAAWESAIESIPGSGCTVVGNGQPFIVTFDALGPKKLELNQDQATVTVSSLIDLNIVQWSTGPNHWNEPLNWSGGVVPGSGDRAILRDGRSTIFEGLNQRATFTVDTTTGNLIMGADITDVGFFVPGQGVYLSTTNAFPSATSGGSITISNSTVYYVTAVDYKTRRLQLSLTKGGSPIEFTSQGTGTHTVEVYLGEFQHHMTYTGSVGLSRRFQGGLEERPRWLKIGAAVVQIGLGDAGGGSGLINADLGARVCSFKQFKSGNSNTQGEYPTNIRANNTGDTIWIGGGGLAISPTDTGSDSSTTGDVQANRCSLLLGKVSVGNLQGLGSTLESPYGYTTRGTTTWLR